MRILQERPQEDAWREDTPTNNDTVVQKLLSNRGVHRKSEFLPVCSMSRLDPGPPTTSRLDPGAQILPSRRGARLLLNSMKVCSRPPREMKGERRQHGSEGRERGTVQSGAVRITFHYPFQCPRQRNPQSSQKKYRN